MPYDERLSQAIDAFRARENPHFFTPPQKLKSLLYDTKAPLNEVQKLSIECVKNAILKAIWESMGYCPESKKSTFTFCKQLFQTSDFYLKGDRLYVKGSAAEIIKANRDIILAKSQDLKWVAAVVKERAENSANFFESDPLSPTPFPPIKLQTIMHAAGKEEYFCFIQREIGQAAFDAMGAYEKRSTIPSWKHPDVELQPAHQFSYKNALYSATDFQLYGEDLWVKGKAALTLMQTHGVDVEAMRKRVDPSHYPVRRAAPDR